MSWLILAPISVIFTLLAMLLAPLLALFVQDDGYLPRWLWWFQTPAAPAIGDAQYQVEQMLGVSSKWWMATCWLARNPAYGFDIACGAKIKDGFHYDHSGDDEVNNTPLHNGRVMRTVQNQDGSTYWQLLIIRGWSDTHCIKINLGWKLFPGKSPVDIANAKAAGLDPEIVVVKMRTGDVRQLVCTINPFTKYT